MPRTATTAAQTRRRSRLHTVARHPATRVLVGLAVVAAAAWILRAQLPALSTIRDAVLDAHVQWVIGAFAVQMVAMHMLARLQNVVVAAFGGEMSRRRSELVTYASTAVTQGLPAGGAFAAGYNYRWLTVAGLTPGHAVVALTLSAGVSMLALGVVYSATVSPRLAEWMVDDVLHVVLAACVAAGIAVVVAAAEVARRRAPAPTVEIPPDAGWKAKLANTLAEVARLPRRVWHRVFALTTAKWMFDLLCLIAACLAVGIEAGVASLATLHVATQVARQIPLTPGGIGIVEAGLVAGLVALGFDAGPAAAAVAIYRLCTYWFPLVAGAGSIPLLRHVARRESVRVPEDRRTPAAA
ncbi:lysylphosphatidylglycerol synthase transmembrane domain-containing protein [Rhodococcus sp. O3]|uniref:lysylphosphatidylglycerol synthase transmembrane domain-containing protein n=1 Tax=Rhodococcus sp. O3 TaxID=3404919 RepID=UPI003B68094E